MQRKRLFVGIAACLFYLQGCGRQEETDFYILRQPYEKSVYEADIAKRGDLEPVISLKLQAEGYEEISYDSLDSELELEKVYVAIGDHVKKGQLLVSFQSSSLKQSIAEYKEKITENRLLVSHYEKLMKINPQLDYREDIASLKKDAKVAELYLEEYENQLENSQIKAKKDGTIIRMDDRLADGVYEAGRSLLTQSVGDGTYSTGKPENYRFKKGEVFDARLGELSYPVCVQKITKEQIIFKPETAMEGVSEQDILTVTITLPKLTDIVYVPAKAIFHKENFEGEDYYFVYVIDENGYRDAVRVKTGGRVGDYMVIKEGLQGGEKVTGL